jgi:hypothetical protein
MPVSFTNKTDIHDITEILLKLALINTITTPLTAIGQVKTEDEVIVILFLI